MKWIPRTIKSILQCSRISMNNFLNGPELTKMNLRPGLFHNSTVAELTYFRERKDDTNMAHNCTVCHIEFPPEISQYVHYHEECLNCVYCGNAVGEDIIEKQVSASSRDVELPPDELTANGIKPKVIVYHPYCHTVKLENDFKNKPVVITQGHLDMLNAANLLFRAKTDLSVSTNQKEAEHMSHKFIHEMTLEEKFISLKRLEAVVAMWSIALSKDKARIQIQLDEKERIKHKELQQTGDRLEYEKKREKKLNTARKDPSMSPEERQKEKAITAFMKIGNMDRETAMAQLGMTSENTENKVQ